MVASLCLIMALGSVANVGHAQVSVGAVLGANRTSLSGDKPKNTSFSTHVGPIAGLVLEIPVAKGVAIVFQPGYRQSGADIGFEVPDQEEAVDSLSLRLNYFSLPILLKVITDGGRWYVTSGFDFGLLTSATLSTVSGNAIITDGTNKISLAGVSEADLDQTDFIF